MTKLVSCSTAVLLVAMPMLLLVICGVACVFYLLRAAWKAAE